MARAMFVKKARKDIRGTDIKKGDSYYWWKFRFGGKRVSKTPPRRSQLTQSEFLGAIYDIEDRLGALTTETPLEEIQSERDSIVEDLRQLGEEQEDKKSNMPDSLQEGSTGELLSNRNEECESMASELEGVDLDLEKEEGESDEDFKSRIESAVDELSGVTYNGE